MGSEAAAWTRSPVWDWDLNNHAKIALESIYSLSPEAFKEFNGAKAVFFELAGKFAIGVGTKGGEGFLIGRDPTSGAWSAPAFFSHRELSVGLSLGTSVIHTIIFLNTEDAVARLKAGKITIGEDFSVSGWYDHGDNKAGITSVSFSDGAMLDASLTAGSIFVNEEVNHNIYGPTVEIAAILSGHVAAPPHFRPVYEAIASLSDVA